MLRFNWNPLAKIIGDRVTFKDHRFTKVVTAASIGIVTMLLPLSVAGASSPTMNPSPDLVACPTSGMSYQITAETQTEKGTGTIYSLDNTGSNQITQNVTFTRSEEYSGSVSISGGGSADFVIFTVSGSVGFTVGVNITNSVSQQVGLTIPAHKWGLIQQAVYIVATTGIYGTYEGGSANSLSGCPLAGKQTVTASLSEANYQAVLATGTASSGTPTWPQV